MKKNTQVFFIFLMVCMVQLAGALIALSDAGEAAAPVESERALVTFSDSMSDSRSTERIR